MGSRSECRQLEGRLAQTQKGLRHSRWGEMKENRIVSDPSLGLSEGLKEEKEWQGGLGGKSRVNNGKKLKPRKLEDKPTLHSSRLKIMLVTRHPEMELFLLFVFFSPGMRMDPCPVIHNLLISFS